MLKEDVVIVSQLGMMPVDTYLKEMVKNNLEVKACRLLIIKHGPV